MNERDLDPCVYYVHIWMYCVCTMCVTYIRMCCPFTCVCFTTCAVLSLFTVCALCFQQETLLQQLKVNREQTLAAMEELDAARATEDQNYTL